MTKGTETMSEKISTVREMKKSRKVPEEVKERVKEYVRIRKEILKVLEKGGATIPEIAASASLSPETVVFHLMTMRKFNEIKVEGQDDMDEYYFYGKAEV